MTYDQTPPIPKAPTNYLLYDDFIVLSRRNGIAMDWGNNMDDGIKP